ncbi:hypothetical protein [Streptomyces natalensis]|uniref:Uncharacterized protein n=1 Tax=Streptomyces natalensis ATCC 27448 TaxID=1240678 RepID=A0A0D7CC73_9ACTN|nr:hypothetical protein [Streptomyces natalensis]KIZ13505.1 hypothetical protein SNA_39385 [Streptomyces natalensis ATCC 27448]
MSNEQVPPAGDRDIIKPLDKHMPIGAPRVPKKKPVKPVTGDGGPAPTVAAADKHMPIGEPQ